MEPEVVLIRHATTVDTRAGLFSGRGATPLDEPGRQQADALARSIGDREWGDVLASPVARAWETAERAGLGARARACDALIEWDYGELTGRNNIEVRRAEPEWNLFVDGAPGGECPDDVTDRLQPLLDSLRSSANDTVVVSHGHLLRALIAAWIGLPLERAGQLVIDPASLSVLSTRHGRPSLVSLNDGSHLAGLK